MGGAEPRAAPRAWRAPDLPRSEHRGRLTASRVLRLALALLALFEAIAVAVHFEDMDVVGEPIEQRAGQPLGPEHAGPLVERQIAGDEGGAALVTLAEDLEQELRAGRRQGDIAEFVDDQQRVGRQLPLLPTAITFSRRAMYSQRASSRTNVLLSEGIAVKSKLSRLFTVGNRAPLMRRSTIRRSRSISSSSARRSR